MSTLPIKYQINLSQVIEQCVPVNTISWSLILTYGHNRVPIKFKK